MASIAELLISGTQEATKETGRRTQQSIQSAVEIAQRQEALQQQKQQMAKAKQDLELKRYESFAGSIEKGFKLEGQAKTNYFKNYIPQRAGMLGIGPDKFDPTVLNMLTSDPSSAKALAMAREKVQSGEMSPSEVQNLFTSPEAWAEQSPQLIADFESALGRKAKVEAAEAAATASATRQQTGIEAKERAKQLELEQTAQKKSKAVLGSEFGKFKAAGGESALRTRIRKIGVVVDALKKGEIKTGGFLQSLPLTGGTAADKVFRKKFREAQGNIKGAINIKQILDSQFGDRAMLEAQENLGIDGALETDQNINKLEELQRSMLEELDNKVDAFQSEGLLDGKKKKEAPKSKFQSLTPSQQKLLVSRRAKKLKISEAEAKKQLEGL
jgi:hypothetical protein